MNIHHVYYDGDEVDDDSESTGSSTYSKRRIVLSAKEPVLKIGGNLDISDESDDEWLSCLVVRCIYAVAMRRSYYGDAVFWYFRLRIICYY